MKEKAKDAVRKEIYRRNTIENVILQRMNDKKKTNIT